MIKLRKAGERGRSRIDWLDSRHTFSFADYYDPQNMGFRTLRVINDDRVRAASGFGTHSHQDMEIFTYVLEGELEHKDSLGTGSVIRPGDVQVMSAGTGVAHSEWNHSKSEPVHFLQIWLLPEKNRLAPGYQQKTFAPDELENRLRLVASRDGRDGSVIVHQDVGLYVARLAPQVRVEHALAPGRHAWVQMARGSASLGQQRLEEGDGAALTGESKVTLVAETDAELLLFDLA